MGRWSFFGVRKLWDNFKPRFAFQRWNGGNSEISSWKKHLFHWARCQKAIGAIYFTKKRRAGTLQPGLKFDNFKPRLKSGIFERISWLNGSYYGGYDRSSLKERVKTYLIAPMSPFYSPILSLSSHLWSRYKWNSLDTLLEDQIINVVLSRTCSYVLFSLSLSFFSLIVTDPSANSQPSQITLVLHPNVAMDPFDKKLSPISTLQKRLQHIFRDIL